MLLIVLLSSQFNIPRQDQEKAKLWNIHRPSSSASAAVSETLGLGLGLGFDGGLGKNAVVEKRNLRSRAKKGMEMKKNEVESLSSKRTSSRKEVKAEISEQVEEENLIQGKKTRGGRKRKLPVVQVPQEETDDVVVPVPVDGKRKGLSVNVSEDAQNSGGLEEDSNKAEECVGVDEPKAAALQNDPLMENVETSGLEGNLDTTNESAQGIVAEKLVLMQQGGQGKEAIVDTSSLKGSSEQVHVEKGKQVAEEVEFRQTGCEDVVKNIGSDTNKNKISKPDRNVGKGARAARLQRNKMMRDQKRATLLKEKRAFSATTSAPRVIVLEAPHGDFMACMEMAKIADLIAFVASANCSSEQGSSNYYIDEFGSQCLSVFRSLGLPGSAVFLRDLPLDLKKRDDLKKTCISSLASEFPEDCKIFPADTKDDLHKVHVSGAGDFQMSKIELLKDPCLLNLKIEGDLMDADEVNDSQVIRTLLPDPLKQESLLVENIPNPLEGEQTRPTEAEMAEADREQRERKRKRGLSLGVAWILDDSDVSGTDSDDRNHLYVTKNVYNFEVVLLEIITGLQVLDANRPVSQHNLVKWARLVLPDKERLQEIIHPRLENNYPSKGATKAL
ncbi:hypothetical protein OSB04_028521 [Centaurea solstitialis]|uniref:Uncharacterized protein n=1 Tax=Centaurea solstitialis TaxID=347529 RepID=A0AA38W7T4_9ASTR|nr:hypothetical protein OSB04_028521 [Centaurea solstitialis]